MRFIHAADLHIDSPLRGLDDFEGAPVERLRAASRQAFIRLVDLAIDKSVDVVILAGDIYDGDWADFRTGLFFREQMLRLRRAHILVFIVKGNHDADSQISRQLPEVSGVHVFSASRSETVDLPQLGIAVHGRSFPQRAVPEDLVPLYPDPIDGRFNIGVLHTSLTGREGHDPYAPTTVDILVNKGYDYFALGHVHAREVIREASPRIVFPGNLQGRHARETGAKGCELVEVVGGQVHSSEFVALDTVRWHSLRLDATSIGTVDELAVRFSGAARAIAAATPERLHVVRVIVEGESPLHRLEAHRPGTVAAAIAAAIQDFDDLDLWIEQVKLEMRSPFDREAAIRREDALGEVVRLVDAISADQEGLRVWFDAQLTELARLPAGIVDASPTSFSLEEIRRLLAEAESTVLAHLSSLQVNGDAK